MIEKSCTVLPEGYSELFSLDLQKDKKTALKVNLEALIIAAFMVVPMLFFVPIGSLFTMEKGWGAYLLRFFALFVGISAYVILHELTHAAVMRFCGTKKVRFGYTGMYAFAGSDDYYRKGPYIAIALAPVVLFGVILTAVCAVVPEEWFWVAYIIQVTNISGAAGDFYVTVRFSRFPSDILIRDYGVGMTVYSKVQK